MANETIENFFSILELDPDAPWDQAGFEDRLRAKQAQWSRESVGPTKKALVAKRRLEKIPEIKRVMSDKAQRAALARDAKEAQSSDQDEKQQEFARRLRRAEAKGFLEESEVAGLVNDFRKVLSEQEIRARIKVKIHKPSMDQNQDEDEEGEIKPTILDDINANLTMLGATDLYQWLQMPATASCEELYQAVERVSDEVRQRMHKTATVNAQTILVGYAAMIFKTQEMRSRYDRSHHYQPLDAMLRELAATVRNTSGKKLYPPQIEAFVEDATKAGFKTEAVERRLRQYAQQQGWQLLDNTTQAESSSISIDETIASQDDKPQGRSGVSPHSRPEIPCGFCGEMNGQDLSVCRNCQSPLSLTCQKCKQSIATNDKRCKSCGFPSLYEVRNLKFQNTALGLRLTWTWPTGYHEARLFHSTEHWAEPGKQNQQSTTVTRAEYEALGHYLLRGATQQNYYIVVSLVTRHEGQQILTPGARLYVPLTNKMDITYEIKNPRFGYKQRTLHLYTQTSGILPTLLLMTRQGDIPVGKTDGTLLHRESGPLSIQREHVIELPDTRFPAKTFGRLFLEDDSLYSVIVIHLPHERKLRLG